MKQKLRLFAGLFYLILTTSFAVLVPMEVKDMNEFQLFFWFFVCLAGYGISIKLLSDWKSNRKIVKS